MTLQHDYQREPRTATTETIEEYNEQQDLTGARSFEPTEEAIERIQNQSQASPRRLTSWVQHPDHRVPMALIESFDQTETPRWWRGDTSELTTALVERALMDAREDGVLWSPLLDKIGQSITGRPGGIDVPFDIYQRLADKRIKPVLEDIKQANSTEELRTFMAFQTGAIRKQMVLHEQADQEVYRYFLETMDLEQRQPVLEAWKREMTDPDAFMRTYKEYFGERLSHELQQIQEEDLSEEELKGERRNRNSRLTRLAGIAQNFYEAIEQPEGKGADIDFAGLAEQIQELAHTERGTRLVNKTLDPRGRGWQDVDQFLAEPEQAPLREALFESAIGAYVEDIDWEDRNLSMAARVLPDEADRFNQALRIAREQWEAFQEYQQRTDRKEDQQDIQWRLIEEKRGAVHLGLQGLQKALQQDQGDQLDEEVLEGLTETPEWTYEMLGTRIGSDTVDDLLLYGDNETITRRMQTVLYDMTAHRLQERVQSEETRSLSVSTTTTGSRSLPQDVVHLLGRTPLDDEQYDHLLELLVERGQQRAHTITIGLREVSPQVGKDLVEATDASYWVSILNKVDPRGRTHKKGAASNVYQLLQEHFPAQEWKQFPGMLDWVEEYGDLTQQQRQTLQQMDTDIALEEEPMAEVTGERVSHRRRKRLLELIEEKTAAPRKEKSQQDGPSR